MILRPALLDMDGTIWETPVRMAAVRDALGLPHYGRPILHAIADLPLSQQPRPFDLLRTYERERVKRGSFDQGRKSSWSSSATGV